MLAYLFTYFKIINYKCKENIFRTCSPQYEIYKFTGGQMQSNSNAMDNSLSLLPPPLVPTNVTRDLILPNNLLNKISVISSSLLKVKKHLPHKPKCLIMKGNTCENETDTVFPGV
jgi:hypothetical protein